MKIDKPIYNQKIKDEFIEYYMQIREIKLTSLVSLFRKTAPYEIDISSDCSSFSKEKILNMYASFNSKSVNVLMNYNSIFKAYCAWLKENNIPVTAAYDEITQDELSPLIPSEAMQLLTREDIDYIESQLYNWTDKAIVECLWEGVAGDSMEDLVSISSNMIDVDNKTLTFQHGKTVKITDHLIELLTKAFSETEYICYGYTGRTKKLLGTNTLYKKRDNADDIDSEDKCFRWVYRKIQIYRNHVKIKKFTMKNISTSGMYYYLQKGMKNSNLDLRSYLLTTEGQCLMDKYGYNADNRTDNVIHRYKQFLVKQ